MSEPDKTVPSAQHRKFRAVGLIIVVFGILAAVNLGRSTALLLQGAGAELRDQGPLVALGVLTQMVAVSIIVAGYQLMTQGDRFSWGNVLGFWTKTVQGQLLLVAAFSLIAGLMWMTATVQNSWAPRAGYWLALWLACSVAVFFLRKAWRQLRSPPGAGDDDTGPGPGPSDQA
ncbi:hypothetical protein BKG76_00160 [Mycobacteroides franklinii]|uniref:Uncharacterized protein n=1 Tax=Mycobacteroides franklinii TaxID=948102 RepID=A0A1S1LHR1_9MYCO|nr:hypothetical protein [Mycobacteroides franklinii]OHU31670.1 hypothetical protein BKG76_00160 [Mycobacteroides franklinii]